ELDQRQDRSRSRESGNGRLWGARKSTSAVTLDAGQSAALRDKLVAEVTGLASAQSAVAWAAGALSAKNSLIAGDAKMLEEAFEQKLSSLSWSAPSEVLTEESAAAREVTEEPQAPGIGHHQPEGIDKSLLTIAAPRRYRNREHLRYVTQQPCLVCGRRPSDSHHLGFMQPRALGRKVSDEFAVPLCRGHHRAVHRARDEPAWWKQAGIDPIKVARRLWKETHGLGRRRSQRAALPRSRVAARASEPIPKNEDISATATTQEETRLPDFPGLQGRSGWMVGG